MASSLTENKRVVIIPNQVKPLAHSHMEGDTVVMFFPRQVKLQLKDASMLTFLQGTQKVPAILTDVELEWLKRNGATEGNEAGLPVVTQQPLAPAPDPTTTSVALTAEAQSKAKADAEAADATAKAKGKK